MSGGGRRRAGSPRDERREAKESRKQARAYSKEFSKKKARDEAQARADERRELMDRRRHDQSDAHVAEPAPGPIGDDTTSIKNWLGSVPEEPTDWDPEPTQSFSAPPASDEWETRTTDSTDWLSSNQQSQWETPGSQPAQADTTDWLGSSQTSETRWDSPSSGYDSSDWRNAPETTSQWQSDAYQPETTDWLGSGQTSESQWESPRRQPDTTDWLGSSQASETRWDTPPSRSDTTDWRSTPQDPEPQWEYPAHQPDTDWLATPTPDTGWEAPLPPPHQSSSSSEQTELISSERVHQPWQGRDSGPSRRRKQKQSKRESRRDAKQPRQPEEPQEPRATNSRPKRTNADKNRRPQKSRQQQKARPQKQSRRPKPPREPGRGRYVLASTLGALLAAGAWYFLVKAAVSFGHAAMNGGQMPAWGFTAAATAGATACMLLVFMLGTRAYAAVRPVSDE